MELTTAEEVREWAMRVAQQDYKRHIENGIDLNPYCTDSARNTWQRGFDGTPPYSWEGSMDFSTMYQRGKAAAEVVAAEKAKESPQPTKSGE